MDLVIVDDFDALVLEPDVALEVVAGLETFPPVMFATLDERLLVLPMLMPPLTVPPDVLRAGFDEFLSIALGPSVWARRP